MAKMENRRVNPNGAVKAFAFDLGNVLLNFDFMDAARRLGARCNGGGEVVMTYARESETAIQLEMGAVSGKEFFESFQRHTGYRGNYPEFVVEFADIFTENTPMVELMRNLRQQFPLYLLSNTNEIHLRFVEERFAFMREFDGHVFSFEERVMKPDARFFRRLQEKYGHPLSEVVFVDDLLVNVEGARAAGMRGVHYQNAEQARRDLLLIAKESVQKNGAPQK